jgi:putative lipoprotein
MNSLRGARGGTAGLALALALALFARPAAAQSADPDPWWGPDKALHFTLSAVIAGGGYGVAAIFTDSRPIRLAVGGGAALLAGGLKELIDLAGAGTPSWKDFTWDVIGCATGLLVAFLLDVFVITPLTQPAPTPAPAH